MAHSPRITALEQLVAKYEKSRLDFTAIQDELRNLPSTIRLEEVLKANADTLASTERMLAMTRERLQRERALEAAAVRQPAPARAQRVAT